MKSEVVAGVAGVAVGLMLREIWLRTASKREAKAMQALANREAAVTASLSSGSIDGDASVQCTRGDNRTFGVSQSDTALVIIDMQADFLHPRGRLGQHYDAGRHAALAKTIAQVESLLGAAREAGLTIAHSRSHRYGAAVRRDLLEAQQPGAPEVVGGTPQHFGAVDVGYELLPSLRALPGEIVVDKWTFGAFASTDLESQLRARGVRKILLAGILTNVCVFATAVQACDRFFRVCLVEDACGAFRPDWHDKAVDLLSGPQCAPGHAGKAVGLYFGEVSTVVHVKSALSALLHTSKQGTPAHAQAARATASAGAAPPRTITIPSAAPSAFAFPRGKCALVMIDWQRDFLDIGGFGHALGNDVAPLQAALGPAAAVLAAARKAGLLIVHTLEAHTPDLADCPAAKLSRCPAIGTTLDSTRGRVLVSGEPGNAIVDAVAPLPGELCVHKPGKGAFWNTKLEDELRGRGVSHLIVTGVTTEVCVQTTVREANDRGYDILVVSDATESYFPHFKASTLEMIVAQGGIVGWTADSAAVLKALAGAA